MKPHSEECLCAECAKWAMNEVKRMKSMTYCAYCGEEFAIDGEAELVSGHIGSCPKHPMRVKDAEISLLSDEVEALRVAIKAYLDSVDTLSAMSYEFPGEET